ncbi:MULTISPECIES: alpha/beta hydrolase [unclassified Streptomyces]|uniref:alpha/beta hydrolase n=1 Tax=unclassified Streptomyces TaxID=2593676 RepID=UPI0035D8CDD4
MDTPPAATTYREVVRLERMAKHMSPHLGGAVQGWTTTAGCLGWPVPAHQADTTPARKVPPALIIQSTHQSSSAYQWAFGLSRQLPGSVVLSREGDDYSMFLFSRCVQDAMDRYLLQRRLPAPETNCTD